MFEINLETITIDATFNAIYCYSLLIIIAMQCLQNFKLSSSRI